eukprot:Nitzschia sp. Nitz4//scaffold48_size128905//84090//85880//NITZ4_003609-RA/size128905-processed-gene-0.92-mRNA-1//1//CDS//3329553009//3631//frame0
MSTIHIAPTTTNAFKSSSSLGTKRHTAGSVTIGHPGQSDINEARYWTVKFGLGNTNQITSAKRKYAQPRSVSLETIRSAITHQVLFGPTLGKKTPPLAVVGGPRVGVYGTAQSSAFTRALTAPSASSVDSTRTIEADRNVQTGGHLALSASFRHDGRLLAVGTEYGEVRVCDVTMRSTLSTFISGKLPVRSVQWFRNGQYILAGGDDATARIWDLSATDREVPLLALAGHGDVVRCTELWENKQSECGWNQLAMTGSYDHTIRVWNVQDLKSAETENRCLAVLAHGSPVEAMCLMKSDNPNVPVWLLSAGGTTIKVWNPVSGSCVATISTQHRKTLTALLPVVRSDFEDDSNKVKTTAWRILSSSLDGVLQFHSWDSVSGSMEHLHSTTMGDPITSLCIDKSGDRLAIGTATGKVLVKMRGPSIVTEKRKREPMAGTYSFFQRGKNVEAAEGDYTVVSDGKKRKLRSFDVALKQFRYNDALDDALATRRPRDVVAVLEELGKRRGLTGALANRDEELLEPILSFTIRYINRPHFTGLLVGVAHKLIDIYGDVAGQSEIIDELFAKLKNQVAVECKTQKSLHQLAGQIDALMAAENR